MAYKKAQYAFDKGYRVINGQVLYIATNNIRKLQYNAFSFWHKDRIRHCNVHQLIAYQCERAIT